MDIEVLDALTTRSLAITISSECRCYYRAIPEVLIITVASSLVGIWWLL